MNRITSKQVVSMMEAVAQVYEQPEVEQLDEYIFNWGAGGGMSQAERDKARRDAANRRAQEAEKRRIEREKQAEAERLARSKERESADRAAGRASEVRRDGVDIRYTRQSDGSTRRDGEVAELGGQRVRWKVDRTGKGSWVDKNGNVVTASASQNSNDNPGGK